MRRLHDLYYVREYEEITCPKCGSSNVGPEVRPYGKDLYSCQCLNEQCPAHHEDPHCIGCPIGYKFLVQVDYSTQGSDYTGTNTIHQDGEDMFNRIYLDDEPIWKEEGNEKV